jgi:hypothetical protein
MGVINLDDIEPGMILCRDITNRNGLVLLTAGDEITEKRLKILRMWGITEADIKGIEKEEMLDKATAGIDPRLIEEATLKTLEIFRHTDRTHPFIKELLQLVRLRLVRRLS